jgi:hypothetical protein
MARNATLKIRISYEANEGFTVLIRPQKTSAWDAEQLTPLILEADIECGFGKSAQPNHPLLENWLPAAKAYQLERDDCGEIPNPV